jgi:hypothetical protein
MWAVAVYVAIGRRAGTEVAVSPGSMPLHAEKSTIRHPRVAGKVFQRRAIPFILHQTRLAETLGSFYLKFSHGVPDIQPIPEMREYSGWRTRAYAAVPFHLSS